MRRMATTAASAARLVKVDVVSDTICPFCYIGLKKFNLGLAKLPGVTAELTWRPFFLDPSLPVEGKDKLTHYKSKFGEARTAQMLPYMTGIARELGIAMSYGGKIAATENSHRVVELALAKGGPALQNAVMESLFKLYFEEEGNLGDADELTRAAVRGGLAEADVRALLAGDEYRDKVRREAAAWARKYGISGVPFFIINGTHAVSGAQDPSAFAEAISAALEEAK